MAMGQLHGGRGDGDGNRDGGRGHGNRDGDGGGGVKKLYHWFGRGGSTIHIVGQKRRYDEINQE